MLPLRAASLRPAEGLEELESRRQDLPLQPSVGPLVYLSPSNWSRWLELVRGRVKSTGGDGGGHHYGRRLD